MSERLTEAELDALAARCLHALAGHVVPLGYGVTVLVHTKTDEGGVDWSMATGIRIGTEHGDEYMTKVLGRALGAIAGMQAQRERGF